MTGSFRFLVNLCIQCILPKARNPSFLRQDPESCGAGGVKATGISGFAMKPLTKREIAKTVRNVLDGKNPV